MTTADALLILAALCDPAPYAGYGWRVNDELAARDLAVQQQRTATTSQEQRRAAIARDAAETRLAHLLDVEPPPRGVITFDDGLGQLGLPDAEQLTCEGCGKRADDRAFRARANGEIDDDICDECLTVQADTAQWDTYNAHAYYHQ